MGGPLLQALLNRAGKLFLLVVFAMFLVQTASSHAQDYYRPKSENAALALSLFGTILPVGTGIMLEMDDTKEPDFPFWLAAGGLVVGPSLGYFYGGVERRAWKGIALRTMVACGTLFIVALIPDGVSVKGHFNSVRREESSSDVILLAVGFGVVTISALTDIFSVSNQVRKRNQKLWYGDFVVLPAYFPKYQATGLQLQILF